MKVGRSMQDVTKYKFFHKLQKLNFVEKIVLFGSRARSDHQERSDIDIAIYCPKASNNDWLQIVDIIDNADTLLKIDCIRLNTLNELSPLQQAIKEDGVVVYEQKNDSSK